ncbi:putative thiamine biosynthetic bifunctional enzyme [Basidiobolus meristosporus CBS 931.73]|uniref:Putative thiamine biosynthetic bifunctional enzyme n=1 Tax=Basidiobolus meristosporus CBS 931.73 TaxID=1314790 RepID=A0A1Y1YU19_9FUNG|nr:putative thiamine biosynthetic bifunctional enzyme [Basidiobolus meristosporus CBS 931.73]|eukprot:ORY01532.1 putative thiamine biosynthetic bifunctional enzyme [Basidiobolus meristosporus CBS 931.73]
MGKPTVDYSLYLVTDRGLLPEGVSLVDNVREALKGGVTLVQLREKNAETKEFLEVGREIHQLTKQAGVPLLINDRIDIALALDCEGVHIGQDDMPIELARQFLGPDKIIGVTASCLEECQDAIKRGADYIGLGTIFPTQTKEIKRDILGIEGARHVLEVISDSDIPVVCIGGLDESNIERALLKTSGKKSLAGVALVSAIIASKEPKNAAERLAQKVRGALKCILEKPAPSAQQPHDMIEKVIETFTRLREAHPLIHHITNYVVINDNANVTLAMGGSPIMADAQEEVAQVAEMSGALVINAGSISPKQGETMVIAGKSANLHNVPIVFDPVGAGATTLRREFCGGMLKKLHLNIVKGNSGEMATLVGRQIKMRGVDSLGALSDAAEIVAELAERERIVAAMSGAIDFASDGKRTYAIENGHPLLEAITGSGCCLTSVIACLAAVSKDDYLVAAVGGFLCMGIAGEIAAARADVKGPGTFRAALIDELFNLTPETIRKEAKIKLVA